MKLVYCPECHDVLKLLTDQTRYCDCGRAWGSYVDYLNAEIGGTAVPLGFDNGSLALALAERPRSGMGKMFAAFVIPVEYDTVKAEPPITDAPGYGRLVIE
ncbi:MAG: hypothetical protein GY803_08065 [Chloroflexi bacterium]|nr:hypothetical protein [Chloroflexota bacterium]